MPGYEPVGTIASVVQASSVSQGPAGNHTICLRVAIARRARQETAKCAATKPNPGFTHWGSYAKAIALRNADNNLIATGSNCHRTWMNSIALPKSFGGRYSPALLIRQAVARDESEDTRHMARLSARTAAGPSSARIFFSRPARAHPNLSSVADDGMSDLEHHHEDDQDGKVALRGIVVAAGPGRTSPLAIEPAAASVA